MDKYIEDIRDYGNSVELGIILGQYRKKENISENLYMMEYVREQD